MKKYIVKYLLGFIVIVTGISISFYVEKQNAIKYKEELKVESLKKLKNNLYKELDGLHFDYGVHTMAKEFSDILYLRGLDLYKKDKDSLGFYLSFLKDAGTVFVENDEEYSAALASKSWTRSETDHLIYICYKYDLRWPVIIDRYESSSSWESE